jgi:redox-sensitive bicupin YhaK (pirin superfamily)
MKKIFHKADTRGHANHGWLNAWHSFSFASYHDPQRVHFGALRVLNDDTIAGKMGFGAHPHDNMEIITIPLAGAIEHNDSMGNSGVIHAGEVQVMSAGSGITHSEKNHTNDPLSLLQIWVFPNQKNVEPRYDQKAFDLQSAANSLVTIISPIGEKEGLNIHQEAWFRRGKLTAGTSLNYKLNGSDHGVYAFLIEGKVSIEDQELNGRDALAVTETDSINIIVNEDSDLLILEVPVEGYKG